ncbi:MAG: 1-acyl-sn-glycerol-3-phosphate acyltransferase [Anaerolineales bacterium]|nr:1-acyl-sn-glycerol-3-phosphate acyltransferase [Anaerolineales bacterium]
MRPVFWFVNTVAKVGTSVMCHIDAPDLHKIPKGGPMIVYSNHTGQIEVPLLYAHLQPRPVTGIAKVETWDGWFLSFLFNLWGAIPIRRGEADMEAMRKSLEALEQGYILAIAPEGTRNKTGVLIRAYPGIVTLALRSGAPLLPVAHWGGENFSKNIKDMKRTDFHIRVGEPFKLDPGNERVTREVRQQMVDEMMYRLAALLPEYYRGAYTDLENATGKYLSALEQ